MTNRILKEVTDAEFSVVAAAAEEDAGRTSKSAGTAIFVLTILLAFVWIAGVAVAAQSLIGPQLSAGAPLELAGLAALAILPALMMVVAGATAREGARARAEAQRLADAADQLLSPAPGAEAATRRLAVAVRGEISALDRALEQTLARIKSVEGEIAKQSSAVDHISNQARNGAEHMILGMERERNELLRISQELTSQAVAIGQSISRHTQGITEAARRAEAEVRAADEALDSRVTSFGAAAALISDRTAALQQAAQSSAESSLRLEQALSNALDVLAKATQLTDAARESAQAATVAANSTASSVRETTSRAVEEAKRAADAIRGEAASIEREAGSALDRLRDAANSARGAAQDVRGALDQRPAEKSRLNSSFLRGPAEPNAPRVEPRMEPRVVEARAQQQPPSQPPRAPEPRNAPAPQHSLFGDRENQRSAPQPQSGGAWTWRELLSSIDDNDAPPPARAKQAEPVPRPARRQQPDEDDALSRLTQSVSEPRASGGQAPAAAATIERAGVRLNEAFSRGALDRIAQRARSGTQARRQAVRSASPDAVNAVADYLDRDANARQEAARFLKADGARIAELLGRGRAAMTAEATRVFLLIDAAAG